MSTPTPRWCKPLACSLLLYSSAVFSADLFKAGAVATDISPKTFPRIIAGGFLEGRGERMASKLCSRAIVLDDGKMQIAFAIVDTCMMDQPLIDEAKALASKQCGIPVDRMMVSATHTHSAPAAMGCLGTRKDVEYARFLIPKIAESIVEAHKRLQPAKIGWGAIDDWEHTHNRRWIRLAGKEIVDPFGQATGRANMHPGYLSKDVVGPSGPVDPQLSVISIQTKAGQPLAVLANYSQHYFGNSPVSADYFGLFCKALAEKMNQPGEGNGPLITAMSQGTSGDLMWMDYAAEKKNITIEQYADGVASYAFKALLSIQHHDHAPLGMIEKTLELKYRVPDAKRLEWAGPIAAKIENDVPKNKEEVYAREALILHERQKTSLKLQAIRIGNPEIGELSIATLPNEVYALTGLKLKWESPFSSHFNIELANGAEGYIPPAEQHELGGYTTWPARTAGLEVEAEEKIREDLHGMLQMLDLAPGRGMSEDAPLYSMKTIESGCDLYIDFHRGLYDVCAVHSGARTEIKGGHALWLPGFTAGSGYGNEAALKRDGIQVPRDKINRSIHLAGGHIETSNLKLGEEATIALWFWLGHESGASERTGGLIDGLGASLKAHQFPDHTVKLEWGDVVTGFSPPSETTSTNANPPAKADSGGLKPETTPLFADDWHFAVLIRDGEELRVHLDGSEKPSLVGKAGKVNKQLFFGKGLQGKLDEITIWDRAIEPSLIAKLWGISKVGEDNARHARERAERAKRASAQQSALLKQHEKWSASMRFRNTKANNISPVTAYLISRGPKGDSQAPGDHLGIGGSYRDSEPGKLFVFNGNAANQIVRGKTIIEPGTWNEVKIERDGSRVKVTLNGKVEIDAELPVTALGVKELFFGRRSDEFAPLEGEFEKGPVEGAAASWSAVGSASATPLSTAPRTSSSRRSDESGVKAASLHNAAATSHAPAASKPLSPEDSQKKIHIRSGFKVELVAAEPVVLDPVAFDWDEKGRMWVVEMADYPLGMDGNGKAGGRVVILDDTNGDGRYDKRAVLADGLNFPTGILTWRDGALVTAAPDILFLKDSDGDGRADVRQVLFTGFSTGNQQLRVNGLRWGMDGWVYCAGGAHTVNYNKSTLVECKLTGKMIDLGSRDFRFNPDTGELDPQTGPSQFGRCRDDWGRWFGVQNSKPLWHYVLQDHYLSRNPHVIPPDPIAQLYPPNPPVYPASHPEKRYHSFNQAGRYTSACGIHIYRGGTLFEGGATVSVASNQDASGTPAPPLHAFTCEPFHNLVQHHVLEDDGVSFKAKADTDGETTDFFASEDRWCRPVMVRDGPDGAIYIADMYRYMIEHPQWLPQQGKDELLPHYREGDDKGRIWKVVRASARSGLIDSAKAKTTFTATLASQNGWMRDKAQMKALWDGKMNLPVTSVLLPEAMAQIAWTKLLLKQLTGAECLELLRFEHPPVREQALQMAERIVWKADESSALQTALAKLVNDRDAKVRLQLACTLGELKFDWSADSLADVLNAAPAGSALHGAAMSSALPHLERVCERADAKSFAMLMRCALATKNDKAIAALVTRLEAQNGLEKLLGVLDEKNLSLTEFAKQVTDAKARTAVDQMAVKLQQAVFSLKTAPTMEALALLAMDRGHRETVRKMLPELWEQTRSNEALNLAKRLQPAGGPDFLLAGWASRTPSERAQIIEALLSSDAWTIALLRRPEASACDATTRARLMQHPKKEIKELAAKAFASQASASRAAVLAKFKPALSMKGDKARGKQVFTAAGCIACHQMDGLGLPLGPDLRSVALHDAEKLMNSILDPSAVIEPGFAAYHCTLKSGEQLYGIVATETSSSLTMKLPGNLTRSVLRSEIKELKSTQTSLMPDGLEALLTPQSAADLIAYLQSPPGK